MPTDGNSFVELNRRFRRLEKSGKPEDTAFESYTKLLVGGSLTESWDDVLKESRVVILGEPGSGKSWEFRARARALKNSGQFAFFIRLDQLVDIELLTLLGPETEEFFTWMQGRREAYFFLDSVDEAKFAKISDFSSALNRFRDGLGAEPLLRTKLFLSSRITEWKPLADGFEFERLFPSPPSERSKGENRTKETKESVQQAAVFLLEPLDREQVKRYASANGVSEVLGFLQALDDGFAWEFARRPLDVEDLISFWDAKRRIGSLTELVEFDLSSKLRPRGGRVELPLSEAEAREGAEWLAAASLFARKFSFQIPDERGPTAEALDPRNCLPSHWQDDKIRALLNRAIFDGEVYGHFRFHHRRVGEYLAARWVADRTKNCAPYVLNQLLTENVRGHRVVRPSLRSVSAWLCIGNGSWNQVVRDLIVEIDPAIHLQFGDPASLSVEYRRQILFGLARLSKSRKRLWLDADPASLGRLANPALAADIAALVLAHESAVDFRIELLEIIRHGRLSECTTACLALVTSDQEPEEIRSHAVLALGAIGEGSSLAELFRIVKGLSNLPNRTCANVIRVLYPNHVSAEDVGIILAKSGPVQEYTLDLPYELNAQLHTALIPDRAGSLLGVLIDLAQTPPVMQGGQKTLPVSQQFYWIGDLFPIIIEIGLGKQFLAQQDLAQVAEALQLLSHMREHQEFNQDKEKQLDKLTRAYPEIRRLYFWRAVAEFRRRHNKEPAASFEIYDHYDVLKFAAEDISWLVRDTTERTTLEDRVVALRIAIEIWDDSGRKLRWWWRIRRAVARDSALKTVLRQSVRAGFLFPLRKLWWRNFRHRGFGKWWWERKYEKIVGKYRWWRGQLVLWRNIRLIESGKHVGWLNRLIHEAGERGQNHWAPDNWSGLEKSRGKRISNATKRGCAAMWRSFVPNLPHEKLVANETSIGVVVGLSGLKVEFEADPAANRKLLENEAKLATRYALEELNGFPPWFSSLSTAHPQAVGLIVCECIEAEWRFPTERKETHEVLAHLAWRGGAQVPLVREKLLSLLSVSDPPNLAILRSAISVLMGEPDPPLSYLTGLAAVRATAQREIYAASLWFSVWLHIDGETAVAGLKTVLASHDDPVTLVVRICSLLSGEEMGPGPLSQNPSYLRPLCLRQLIPIVYRYVSFRDDIDHGGETYSPTARDHAQQFRNALLSRLENDEDDTATQVLRELADNPDMQEVRDWTLRLLEKRLLREADFAPWTPTDLREFAAHYETDPKYDRELFNIAMSRLQGLKWDVEKSDNSAREELRAGDREMVLRRWLQRRLNERSQARYTIPQEPEIDQQERPDLRLENPKTGPVSIEVKWADSWPVETLLERLENQLVGQYLRAHNSRFGIYFLGIIQDTHYWKQPATREKLSASQVVGIVAERAKVLMQQNAKIGGLEVVCIDFRQPMDRDGHEA